MGAHRELLIVCTGNICRSPMAEYIVRERLGANSNWRVRSAGVFAYDGGNASLPAIEALQEWGIDLKPHRSQGITQELVDAATLIVVMTHQHREEVLRAYPETEGRVRLMTSFSTASEPTDVMDPIGGSINVYRTVRDQINSAAADMILYMKEEWGL